MLPPQTKENLLRHEKGGLLKRMMELDPTREYEAGEIWGTNQKPAAPAPPKPAPQKKPAAPAPPKPAPSAAKLPTPPPSKATPSASTPSVAGAQGSSAAHSQPPATAAAGGTWRKLGEGLEELDKPPEDDAVAKASAPTRTQPAVSSATRASVDYSKFAKCVDDDLDGIDDESPSTSGGGAPAAGQPAKGDTGIATKLGLPTAAVDLSDASTASAAAAAAASSVVAEGTEFLSPESASERAFTYVRVPFDCALPIESQTGFDLGGGDILPRLLAPLFKGNESLDEETVQRETAARFKELRMQAAAERRAKGELVEGDQDADENVFPHGMPSASELDRQVHANPSPGPDPDDDPNTSPINRRRASSRATGTAQHE